MAYTEFISPKKKKSPSVVLSSITNYIPDKVHKELLFLGKPFPMVTYDKVGAVHGKIGDLPVVAFTMHGGSYHCVCYTKYVKTPRDTRFLNATSDPNVPTKLGLLGCNTYKKDDDTIFLTEGVWDFLTLYEQGYNALGLPGVNNFREEWLPFFQDKIIYIVFDNDEPGSEYAAKHARLLFRVAKQVSIINISKIIDSHPAKDISDIFTILDKVKAEKFLQDLISNAPRYIYDVHGDINEILLDKGGDVAKAQIITELIFKDLQFSNGSLFVADEGNVMVLNDGVNVLIDSGDKDYANYIMYRYGYNSAISTWSKVYQYLCKKALHESATLHRYSAYIGDDIYIGIKDKGLLHIAPEQFEIKPQGTNGIYVTSPNKIDLSGNADDCVIGSVEEIIDLFEYEDNVDEQKYLLKAWFYYTFFNSTIKPIMCFTGSTGVGKTLLGKFFKGVLFGFDGNKAEPLKEPDDDYNWGIALQGNKYLFLDEVTKLNELTKLYMRIIATGQTHKVRLKYDKHLTTIFSNVFLIVNSYNPKFREIDIAKRLCVIKMESLDYSKLAKRFGSEEEMFKKFDQARPKIWKAIIDCLQEILQNLKKHKDEKIVIDGKLRHYNWASWCYKAFPDERDLCVKSFNWLDMEQSEFSAEGDIRLDWLEDWWLSEALSHSNGDGYTKKLGTKVICQGIERIAQGKGARFHMSVESFGHWLAEKKEILSKNYGYERVKDGHTKNWMHLFKLPDKTEEKF